MEETSKMTCEMTKIPRRPRGHNRMIHSYSITLYDQGMVLILYNNKRKRSNEGTTQKILPSPTSTPLLPLFMAPSLCPHKERAKSACSKAQKKDLGNLKTINIYSQCCNILSFCIIPSCH